MNSYPTADKADLSSELRKMCKTLFLKQLLCVSCDLQLVLSSVSWTVLITIDIRNV